jgi:hypothetical protein
LLKAGIAERDKRITEFEIALSAIVRAWEAEDESAVDVAIAKGRVTLEGPKE